jgi:hypothetical protein
MDMKQKADYESFEKWFGDFLLAVGLVIAIVAALMIRDIFTQ